MTCWEGIRELDNIHTIDLSANILAPHKYAKDATLTVLSLHTHARAYTH